MRRGIEVEAQMRRQGCNPGWMAMISKCLVPWILVRGGETGTCRLGWLVRPQNVQGLNRSPLLTVGRRGIIRPLVIRLSHTNLWGWSDPERAPTYQMI